MTYKKHILLGRITKIHGFHGAVTIKIERYLSENIPEMESVFLEIDGRPVPFFLNHFEKTGPEILRMKFDGYNAAAKVKEFVGCNVFIPDFPQYEKINDNIPDIVGYKIVTTDNLHVGIIIDIFQNRGQWLLNVVDHSGKFILIPLHEDLVLDVVPKKKLIVMDIPDGIADIN